MAEQKGSISINAQDIMPIIKKWLYSDKDIFVRELVSNASDAITKHKHLVQFGTAPEFEGEHCINVTVDAEAGTLSFEDNGIGMTSEEVEKYINQVAFSGAREFLEKYKDDNDSNQIIGHFGLGFYSAFMVAEKVTIDTLSWQEGAQPVLWESEDGMEFSMNEGTRTQRGTTITLKISEEEKDEFLSYEKINSILLKYCSFISSPLYSVNAGEEDGEKRTRHINDTQPLWLKKPSDCTDEEYKNFYHKIFTDFEDPLFYVHLNADYPFNLKGILYFPRFKDGMGMEGQVKMFCGQVFVADNVSEVIPEFLLLLKGVIDCPDIPLNVSRSFLQNDEYVKKLSAYITRKVADKINSIKSGDEEQYHKYWKDIGPFIKYGCLKDQKFYDRVKDSIIFESTEGKFFTLTELKNETSANDGKIYYTTDPVQQSGAIKLFTANGHTVINLSHVIDLNFISFLEYSDTELKFLRVDSDTEAISNGENNGDIDADNLKEKFAAALGDENIKVEAGNFGDQSVHAIIKYNEQMRRYMEMSKVYGESFSFPSEKTLVVNSASPLIKWLSAADKEDEKTKLVANQVSDLASLMVEPLSRERMESFLERSGKILDLFIEKNKE